MISCLLLAIFFQAVWDGRDGLGGIAANGVYLARLVTPGGGAQVQKLVLLK